MEPTMTSPAHSEMTTINDMLAYKGDLQVTLPTKEMYNEIRSKHANLHQGDKKHTRLELGEDVNAEGDLSCSICYPLNEKDLTQEFVTFRDEWFQPLIKPYGYTQNTIACFESARNEQDQSQFIGKLKMLLYSVRYKTWPREGLQSVLSSLLEVWKQTSGFEQMDDWKPSGRSTPRDNSYGGPSQIAIGKRRSYRIQDTDDNNEDDFQMELYSNLENMEEGFTYISKKSQEIDNNNNDSDDDNNTDDDNNDENGNSNDNDHTHNTNPSDQGEVLHITVSPDKNSPEKKTNDEGQPIQSQAINPTVKLPKTSFGTSSFTNNNMNESITNTTMPTIADIYGQFRDSEWLKSASNLTSQLANISQSNMSNLGPKKSTFANFENYSSVGLLYPNKSIIQTPKTEGNLISINTPPPHTFTTTPAYVGTQHLINTPPKNKPIIKNTTTLPSNNNNYQGFPSDFNFSNNSYGFNNNNANASGSKTGFGFGSSAFNNSTTQGSNFGGSNLGFRPNTLTNTQATSSGTRGINQNGGSNFSNSSQPPSSSFNFNHLFGNNQNSGTGGNPPNGNSNNNNNNNNGSNGNNNNNNNGSDQMLHQLLIGLSQVLQNNNNNNNNSGTPNTYRKESRLVDFPEFKGGNQDPIEWLETFDRACKANSIGIDRRMDIVGSYLKGVALTWFNRSGAREWENSMNMGQSFTHLFRKQFCDPFKMSQWKHQLRNRKQRAGETVEEYTSAMEELWKRIDPTRQRTELDRISEYIEGLRPEFVVPVQSTMPQTVAEAINKAKATETAFSMGADLSAYSVNPGYLPNLYGAAVPAQTAHVAFMSRINEQPSVNNIEAMIEQKLKESIEKVLNRNTYSNNNSNNNNNNRGYNNNANRNRNRDKECYICKKKGHIARDCWNKNRQQDQRPNNSNSINNNRNTNQNRNNNRSSGNGQNSQNLN